MNSDSSIQSICVLRLSAIGDVCNAIATVQAVARCHPKASITWVCGKLEAQLLTLVEGVNVVVFDKKQGWKAYANLRRTLGSQRFDVLLNMQVSMRANALSCFIPAKRRIGYPKPLAKELQWLFCNEHTRQARAPHVADAFFEFARQLGSQEAQPSWNLTIPDVSRAWAKQQIGGNALILCPCASNSERNWHQTGYMAIIDEAQRKGLKVILCGGPSQLEQETARELELHPSQPLNLVGKTSLVELAALLEQAALVVAPDSGPAHLASAVSTPVLGLYAAQNPQRTGPYHSVGYTVSVWAPLIEKQTGKPASQQPWRSRVKAPDAMQHITIEQVLTKFKQLNQELELSIEDN